MIPEELREAIAEMIPDIMESMDEFGGEPFSLQELVDCIIIEGIKPIFEKTLRISSPRVRLIEQSDSEKSEYVLSAQFDKERRALGRKIEYAEKYRQLLYENLLSTRGLAPSELLPPELGTMKEKLAGRRFNNMQFDEIENLKSLRILKTIDSGALASSKNVSIDKFEELFRDYSAYVKNLCSIALDDEALVYNTFALYGLRWHYPIELYYQIVCEAECIPDADPFLAVLILSTKFPIYTEKGQLFAENRFILHRGDLVPLALRTTTASWTKEKIDRYIIAKCRIFDGFRIYDTRISDYIEEKTGVHDWAEFIRSHYPILQEHPEFQWTPRRTLAFRNLLQEILRNSALENKFSKLPKDK